METYQLTIKQTQVTPYVSFNFKTGFLTLSGDLYPENPHYLFDEIEGFIEKLNETIDIDASLTINIYVINSSSHKRLIGLINKLTDLFKSLNVRWVCESEDADHIETGYIYKDLLDTPVDVVVLRPRGKSAKVI